MSTSDDDNPDDQFDDNEEVAEAIASTKAKKALLDDPKYKRLSRIKFIVVASFSLLAGLSFAALLFLMPFVVDPALSTLMADFVETPVECRVQSAEVFIGLKACSWSSCREGCTRDLFKCFQIKVDYYDELGVERFNASLLVNFKGCGYPPHVSCETFFQKFNSSRGNPFKCHYSRMNASVVLAEVDNDAERLKAWTGSGVPIGLIIASMIVVIIVHNIDVTPKMPKIEETYRPSTRSAPKRKMERVMSPTLRKRVRLYQ